MARDLASYNNVEIPNFNQLPGASGDYETALSEAFVFITRNTQLPRQVTF